MKPDSQVIVDGTKYTIGMLQVDHALEVFAWLTKRFGPSLGKMLEQNLSDAGVFEFKKILDIKASDFKISDMIIEIASNVNAEELQHYARMMATCVSTNGNPIEYDAQFMGHPGHLFKVMFQVVRHNFSDFFSGGPANRKQNQFSQKQNVNTMTPVQ